MKLLKESKLWDYRIVLFVAFWVIAITTFTRQMHHKAAQESINVDLSKDSVIHILTTDKINYELRITGKDSLLRLYYNKTQYLELMLTKKDKKITNVSQESKKLKTEIATRDKKIDSLVHYINSLERVSVPD